MADTIFADVQQAFSSGGVEAAFERLIERLKAEKQYHELFDARLMQSRCKLGLPVILTFSLDDLPEAERNQVEEAYLAACREVGSLLLAEGRIREAWMYLRPVGDKQAVAEALDKAETNEENVEELIEVALHQGVSSRRGFELVLANYGTCNAISMFDAQMHDRPKRERQEVAGLLVRHLHNELIENVRADIQRQQGAPPPEATIEALVADRDWLFADSNYHIDTSHLSATVRFARNAEDPEVLRLAVDLCEYGRGLGSQYQFAGDEPFADAYTDQGLFFRGLLGQQVDEAVKFFGDKARSLEVEEIGTGPVEVYVVLLARLGRYGEAIEALADLVPPGVRTSGFAPTVGEMAKKSGEYGRMQQLCENRGDVLGFTASLVESALPNGEEKRRRGVKE
jgi:hypothetical protein